MQKILILVIVAIHCLSGVCWAEGSAHSNIRLYYNVLNAQVRMTENEITSRNTQPDLSLLDKIAPYLEDEDEATRLYAFDVLRSLMENAQNLESRQRLVNLILKGLTDKAQYIAQATAKWLLTYPEENFDDDARNRIYNVLRMRNQYPSTQHYVILLSGLAQIPEATPLLEPITRLEPDNNQRLILDANLALARMGSEKSLAYLLHYFDIKKDTNQITDLMKDLAYTKQPRAYEILIPYIYGDRQTKATKIRASVPLSHYVAWYLSNVMPDFPVRINEPKLTVEELAQAREWMRANYSAGRLRELARGEIQFWR